MAKETAALLTSLAELGLFLAVAESVTGGLLTSTIVDVPGASRVLLGGVVAYDTQLKHQMLGVARGLLRDQGAVSADVATHMAAGVRAKLAKHSGHDEAVVIGVATTGVAGPDPQDGIPAGTVFIGLSGPSVDIAIPLKLSGSRNEIRKSTVAAAIAAIWEQFA